jgi:parafibromin
VPEEIIPGSKAKRLAKKRTIMGTDDIGLGSDLHVMLDFNVNVTEGISGEKQWKTRTTIFHNSGKVTESLLYCII